MGKKVRTTFSNKENSSPRATEKTIVLDSSNGTDIIECSLIDENKCDFIKKGKCSFKRSIGIQSPQTPLQFKELGNSIDSLKSGALRLSLRKSYELADNLEENGTTSLKTPRPCKNSLVNKFLSSLKKTPQAPLLSKSKLRNIERWLSENQVETVRTPPFANLSVTPKTSSKKKPNRWKDRDKISEESSIDSEVEGVLKAVYGDDWKTRARTEPKKKPKRHFSPASKTASKPVGSLQSVRRNILSGRTLNFVYSSDEENNFNDSVLSGIQMINLDSSNCSYDEPRAKNIQKKRKCRAEDLEPVQVTPAKKKAELAPSNWVESKKPTPKTVQREVVTKTPKRTFLASLSVSTPTSKCHPEAQAFKINFKSKKDELVKKLFKLYNSEVFGDKLAEDMNFSWNVKLRGTAGYCYNKRITKSTGEIIRLSRVEFSTKIVDRADRLRDTMIHELCHAASWVIDGVLDGHGAVWSKWANKAMDRFPELPTIRRCHNYDIVSKYVYRCTSCGYSIKRHSKSINTERKRCGYCYGVLELLVTKKKKGTGEVPQFDTTRTLRTPNKFAMFVKENYHTVKNNNANAKHADIMKTLSQQYALIKSGTKSAKKLQTE